MSIVITGASLAVLAIVQAVVFPAISTTAILPDFTLVIILIWSAVRGTQEGLVWAFAIGLLLDTLALDPLGANALALLPAVLLGGMNAQRFFHSGLIVPVLAAVAATLFHTVLLLLIRSSGGGASLELAAVGRLILYQGLLNVILVPPVYLVASMAQRPPAMRHA
ncbi:MAG: rod shape-determining protein MreD [Thermomicrobiales bacterium]